MICQRPSTPRGMTIRSFRDMRCQLDIHTENPQKRERHGDHRLSSCTSTHVSLLPGEAGEGRPKWTDGGSRRQCPFCHLQGAILGLVSSNKARRVNEDRALNARNARKVLVSHPAPSLRQRLATHKAFRRDRDRLYAPVTTSLVRIDDIERLRIWRYLQLLLELKQVLLLHGKSSAEWRRKD